MATIDVIFTKTIKGVGQLGQRKQVKLGYFRNYLLPNGLALVVNDDNLNRFKSIEKKELKQQEKVRAVSLKVKDALEGKVLTISASARNGKLYGSVTASNIASLIKDGLDQDVTAKSLSVTSIKELGKTSVVAYLDPDVEINFHVNIISEGELIVDEEDESNDSESEDSVVEESDDVDASISEEEAAALDAVSNENE